MDKTLLENIGRKLRFIRVEKGITQEALANMCKTDASYIRKVESGKVNISISRLSAIIGALEMELAEFFDSFTN